jgi:hypothetical protein
MKRAPGNGHLPVDAYIGIGQIDRKEGVILLDGGAKKQRLFPSQAKLQKG